MNIKDLIAEVRADTETLTTARDRGDFDPFTAEGAVLIEALADAAPFLADEVDHLTGELDSTYQLLRETLFAGPLVTGRTADSLRVRDRLLGWVFTSFAAELEKSTAPNNLSISMTPDEDHTYAGYRLDLTIARPGHVSTHEQNDALRADVERLTTALADALDEAKAADLHRNLNRRVAGALGLLDERVDADTGEAYLPSWHDMPEQVTALRAEVDRLTAERDAHSRAKAANSFAQDSLRDEIDMLRRERHAERLLVQDRTAEIVELRLTLAAEQGRAEGAPSPHWTYSGGTWSRVRFRVERDGDGFWSLLGLFGDAYCTLNHGIPARIAMQFGDRIDQIARLSHTGTEPDPDKTP